MPKLRSTYDERVYLQNILRMAQGFSLVQYTCKIVRSSKIVYVNWLTYDIPEINFSTS